MAKPDKKLSDNAPTGSAKGDEVTHRRIAISCLIALLSLPSAAKAQEPPAQVTEKRHINVNLSTVQAQDLTNGFNSFMPGVSAGVDFPIGRGRWVAIEGSYHWQEYPPYVGMTPQIRRWGWSAAARLGRASGNGPFVQVGAGTMTQSLDGIGGSRYTGGYLTGSGQHSEHLFWLGPGVGVDIRASQRIAVRLIAEMMVVPPSNDAASRVRLGLVYRFPARTK